MNVSYAAEAAQADTYTGTQIPDFAVTASLLNVGGGADGDEDTAAAGEKVRAAASVENTTQRRQLVRDHGGGVAAVERRSRGRYRHAHG